MNKQTENIATLYTVCHLGKIATQVKEINSVFFLPASNLNVDVSKNVENYIICIMTKKKCIKYLI